MEIEPILDVMQKLVSPGLVAVIIAVTQALLMLASAETRERMHNYVKMGLCLLVGAAIPPLGAYLSFVQYGTDLPANNVWFVLVLIGLVNGVIAAGTVGMGFKVVKNVRASLVVNNAANGTYGAPARVSGMIE